MRLFSIHATFGFFALVTAASTAHAACIASNTENMDIVGTGGNSLVAMKECMLTSQGAGKNPCSCEIELCANPIGLPSIKNATDFVAYIISNNIPNFMEVASFCRGSD